MADVIKSFLVSLNYKVDEASKKKFEGSAEKAEKNISALGKTMTITAIAFVAGVTKIASELERMQFMSRRVGASSANIKSFQYAISQMGGTAAEAAGSLESLAQKLRSSPGYYGLLNRLGVQTKTANGGLRDTVDIVSDLSKSLRSMPYYKASAYANVLGIDEKTLLAIQDGSLTEQMDKYKQLRSSVGLGSSSAAEGHAFMQEARTFTTMLSLIIEKFGIASAEILLPVIKRINTSLQDSIKWFNTLSPQIKNVIKLISSAAIVFIGLGSAISVVSGALKILSAIFGVIVGTISLPITLIAALGAAILLLWDDYKVWKEGGESFIDWKSWAPGIEQAIKYIGILADTYGELYSKAFKFLSLAGQTAKNTAVKAGTAVAKTAVAVYNDLAALVSAGEGGYGSYNRGRAGDAGGKTMDFSKMTVGQIMAAQALSKNDPNRLFAVGKYQVIPSTLKSAVKSLGIKSDEKFTPELQERLFNNYLISSKQPAIKNYITGKGSLEAANIALANEFASFVNPQTGVGAYDKVGGNKASISPAKAQAALQAMNSKYMTLANHGYSTDQAWGSFLGAPTGSASTGNSSGVIQTNNITVNGASNPQEVAKAVKGGIDDANARLVRNTSNAIR